MLLSILHCQAMLRKNSGTESSFESQRVRVQANMADLTFLVWLKVKKTDRCASSAFHKSSKPCLKVQCLVEL